MEHWGAQAVWGSYEIPYGVLHTSAVLLNVYRACSKLFNAVGKDIHRLTNDERELLGWLRDEGLL